MNPLPLAQTPYLTRLNSLQIAAIYALLGSVNQDDRLRYTWINKPIPGFSAERILNRRDADFMERPEDAETIEKIKRRVLDSGVGTREEIGIHSDGIDRFYDLTVEPLQEKSSGRVIGLTGAAFDITRRKLSEEQTRQHQAELAHVARLSVAGEMAAGLAHELSQPLMITEISAKHGLHHMQANPGHSEDLMTRMEQVAEQGHRALEIIRRMRNFTRKTKLQRTRVDINVLIRDIAYFIETEVKRNRINLQFKLADSLPAVFADAIQIQQVVTNLMRNAIEAMQNTEAGKRQTPNPQRGMTFHFTLPAVTEDVANGGLVGTIS